jgi:hypothetical protein
MDPSQSFRSAPSVSQIADLGTAKAQNQAHNTMDQLASSTGGKAYYSRNDLLDVFGQTLKTGSDYYTLTYSPSNHDDRGGFRSIHVQLEGEANSRSLKIAYRRGYYLVDARHAASLAEKAAAAAPNTETAPGAAPPRPVDHYALALMQHGAPAPSEILFKVRVLPAAPGTADATGEHRPTPSLSGASQRYELDFSALPSRIDMPVLPDGNHHGAVEFVTFVYDGQGKLLDTQNQTMRFNLTPDNYALLLKGGIGYSQQVTAGPHAESFRIAVHDLSSGRLGIVEVPIASVKKLPSAPAAP